MIPDQFSCLEIKFSQGPFTITKPYAAGLAHQSLLTDCLFEP